MAQPRIKSPHLLLASSNPHRLMTNLKHLLTTKSIKSINAEVERNVVALFRLGEHHLQFARVTDMRDWRQRVSRFYYAGYNIKRSIALQVDGSFSTDSSDHSTIDVLPKDFPDVATFGNRLKVLREDRNLADYSHDSTQSELVISQNDAEAFILRFADEAKNYLRARGVNL